MHALNMSCGQLKDTHNGICKVGFIQGAPCSASKLIESKDMPHTFENVLGLMKDLFQSKEPCLVIDAREYTWHNSPIFDEC